MTEHDEKARLPYTELPAVAGGFAAIAKRYRAASKKRPTATAGTSDADAVSLPAGKRPRLVASVMDMVVGAAAAGMAGAPASSSDGPT